MKKKEILVERFPENPLVRPEDVDWINRYPEGDRAVFNCGVVFDEENKIFRMLLRGGSGPFSDVGYAESKDGIVWEVKKDSPVLKHDEDSCWSGYCARGIEDTRIVKWVDGLWYILATACSEDNFDSTRITGRVGIWRTSDFKKFEWVSCPFNIEDKDASIFPEPIGRYVYLLHRKDPDIWICKSRDLKLRSGWTVGKVLIKAPRFYKNSVGKRPQKIGIAGPPIKTPKGWLVVTHVVHSDNTSKWWKYYLRSYTLGFMVLDLENPTLVKYVHQSPILWPQEEHEIYGNVARVCFSCATVDYGDDIYVYWGGADTVICGGRLRKSDLPMCY